MKKNLKLLLVTLSVATILSSCATLFQGSRKDVTIRSMTSGADIYVDGEKKSSDALTIKLKRNTNHTIVVKKDGFDTKTVDINKHTQAGWLVWGILFNIPGMIVDAITGAWNGFDKDNVTVDLEKSKS
jgi:hypothetical protein